jgi:hypothetical protein
MKKKKKERPERSPERPIETSKLIDKYVEKGQMTTYPHGILLPDSSDSLGLSLETIGPDLEKEEVRATSRTLSLGIIALAIIIGAYVQTQSTSARGQVIQIGSSHLRKEGIYVWRVLSVKQEEVTPNFRFNYSLKFERPDLVGDRLCWLVRFEPEGRLGHYIEVWIDVSENLVVGGIQCR